jgi:hypothetical protein
MDAPSGMILSSGIEFASSIASDPARPAARASKCEHSPTIKRTSVNKKRLIASGWLRWQHYQVGDW